MGARARGKADLYRKVRRDSVRLLSKNPYPVLSTHAICHSLFIMITCTLCNILSLVRLELELVSS